MGLVVEFCFHFAYLIFLVRVFFFGGCVRNRGKRQAKDRHEREMGSSLTCFCFLIELHFHFTLIWGINGGLWGKKGRF